MKVRKS